MRAVFLGTGTSHGVPTIGCDCAVCRSADPRDRRLRSSLYVQAEKFSLLFDTSPDFRQQALRFGVRRVDAVFLTHHHADHLFGMDDLRRFGEMQGGDIPLYGSQATLAVVRRAFAYAFEEGLAGTTRPHLAPRPLAGPVEIGGLRVTPVDVFHGPPLVQGYRVDAGGRSLGYVSDCSGMPPAAVTTLSGVDVMILDALRPTPHPTHLSLPQSLELLGRIGARVSYITHLCHRLGHAETARTLPDGVRVSFDGEVLEW